MFIPARKTKDLVWRQVRPHHRRGYTAPPATEDEIRSQILKLFEGGDGDAAKMRKRQERRLHKLLSLPEEQRFEALKQIREALSSPREEIQFDAQGKPIPPPGYDEWRANRAIQREKEDAEYEKLEPNMNPDAKKAIAEALETSSKPPNWSFEDLESAIANNDIASWQKKALGMTDAEADVLMKEMEERIGAHKKQKEKTYHEDGEKEDLEKWEQELQDNHDTEKIKRLEQEHYRITATEEEEERKKTSRSSSSSHSNTASSNNNRADVNNDDQMRDAEEETPINQFLQQQEEQAIDPKNIWPKKKLPFITMGEIPFLLFEYKRLFIENLELRDKVKQKFGTCNVKE